MADTKPADNANAAKGNFFINNGLFSGHLTTPEGDAYDIRKLEPREVTNPKSGEVSTIWGGYATARDRALAAKDSMLQTDFKATGKRPADLFPDSRSTDIPLYITLREHAGKGFDLIGSFWNSKSRFTILARDLGGKNGLRFGGNLLPWKSPEALAADRTAKSTEASVEQGSALNADAARAGAKRRVKSSADPKLTEG